MRYVLPATHRLLLGGLAALVTTALFTESAVSDAPATLRIGTLEAEQVFETYTGRQQMNRELQQLQQQGRQAQQAGNRQAAMAARQQMQQVEQRFLGRFRDDLEHAAEQIANERDLDLVVIDLTFSSDDVETVDLTEPLTEAVNAAFDAEPLTADPGQALRDAALQGDLDTVRQMLNDDDSAPQATGPQGETALMMAAYNGHTKIVKLLLEHGAQVNATDAHGRSGLLYAASGPFAETVELLLSHGADVDRQDDAESYTPLMFAAAEGNTEVVRRLLEAGADASIKNDNGETALDFARQNEHTDTARLIESHAN